MYNYYTRLHTESIDKIKLISNYYMDIVDSEIKRDYDLGLILMAYTAIRKAGIPCIIVGPDPKIPEMVENPAVEYFHQDWWKCSIKWPDTIGSQHTSEEGHADTAARLISHIESSGI